MTSTGTTLPDAPGAGRSVVVGIDGSDAAEAAALWAAGEAQRRGVGLHLLHAFAYPTAGAVGMVRSPELDRAAHSSAQGVLDDAVHAVKRTHPGLAAHGVVQPGSPVTVLREASRTAVLTVVGSHGEHQLTEALLGSVPAKLGERAYGPVVVVRGDQGRSRTDDGPVVIGVDGSASSEDALRFAFEEAALRRVPLVTVRAWDAGALEGFLGVSPLLIDPVAIDQAEQKALADQLSVWGPKFPEVVVRPVVARGSAVKTLLRWCSEADHDGRFPALVVVGSRGRGGFAGLLLGSTSRALIAHAPCAVAVVRPA